MRVRISSALFGVGIFCTVIIFLYQTLSSSNESVPVEKKTESIAYLESRVHKLEDDLASNHETVKEIKKILKQIANTDIGSNLLELPQIQPNKFHRTSEIAIPIFNATKSVILQDDCIFSQSAPSAVDIQIKDVLDLLPFDNPDGGAWKQGWDIQYEASQWTNENKLKVFVVPHSHNDPGWIKTFEKYFDDQTSHILDNMVVKLQEDRRRKFIWAEISFFSLWWETQPERIRDQVKKLIANGQFEIVTGGWVMPDEASTHYFAIIDQLLTGHEWLQENLGVKPSNGWSIDPFGMSPSMAYILKMSGLKNMLIHRTHYSLKKHLAKEKSLEFRWRQTWDTSGSTDILCHMMPFYSYDVPHTCGPDPKVCCQFDFRRLPGSGIVCPWRIPPQPINDFNVESRANLILDQYRKKAQLYKTNVLLVPLGDDFRYDRADEWDKQFVNYQKLFDFMNQKEDLHVQAEFGTLNDYFRALRQEASTKSVQEEAYFPSLSGDFFAYADRDEHYWTGYFTTRPFWKIMDRTLHAYIRSAEIVFSLMLETEAHSEARQGPWFESLRRRLQKAHQSLALFQHHDGVTGTSKSFVLVDYANRLLEAIRSCQHVIEQASHSLLRKSGGSHSEEEYFEIDEQFMDHKKLAQSKIVHLNSGVTSTFYVLNTEAHKRQHLYSIVTDHPYVEIKDRSGETIQCQIDPVFSPAGLPKPDQYQVNFIVSSDSLSLSAYTAHGLSLGDVNPRYTTFAKVVLVNTPLGIVIPDIFSASTGDSDSPFTLHTGQLKAEFNADGFLKQLTSLSHQINVNIQFVAYDSRGSGAYLFLPRGEARPISTQALPKVIIEGPLRSSITVYSSVVTHQVVLKNSPGLDGLAPSIHNFVDISARKDIEVAMRLSTSVANGPVFYTDLNSLQIIKRTRYSKLPLQANFYPVTSQVYIEDDVTRLTLISAQSLGASSLKEGQIEVMLDRQLTQDDNLGLGEGIRDNVLTHHKFFLLLEKKIISKEFTTHHESQVGLPSMTAHDLVASNLRPLRALHPRQKDIQYVKHWSVGGDLPCDVSLVSLRPLADTKKLTKSSSAISLTLHRVGFSCALPSYGHICTTSHGKVRLNDLFPASFGDQVSQVTLSHLYEGVATTKSYTLSLQPMELHTYRLTLSA